MLRIFYALALVAMVTLAIPHALSQGTVRTWTTTEGRTFQATLVQVKDGQATLKLTNGQMATIAMTRLSTADQTFLQPKESPAPSPAATPAAAPKAGPRLPPEKRTWPQKVEVDPRTLELTTVKEDVAAKQCVYRTKNFQFTSEDKLAGSVMKEIARTFEATHELVAALPWGIDPQPPQDLGYYQAKFFVTRESYIADGGPPNSGGVYFSKDRFFRVPFQSLGLEMRGKTWFKDNNYRSDTIIHEVTHQMMHDFLPFLPNWVAEGTAEYTSMLPYNAGRFISNAHERGLKSYMKEAADQEQITPRDLGIALQHIQQTGEEWTIRAARNPREMRAAYYASLMMVYFFNHLDGDGKGTRWMRYMDKLAEARDAWATFFKDPRVGKPEPDGSFRYSGIDLPAYPIDRTYGLTQLDILLAGRDQAKLQQEVTDAFKKIGIRF